MRPLDPSAAWDLLREAQQRRAPLLVLACGDPTPLVSSWRDAAAREGVAWIAAPEGEPGLDEPFGWWLDRAAALDPGRARASWLAAVREAYSDGRGPMLPDSTAVAFALLRQLQPSLDRPSIVVLGALGRSVVSARPTDDDIAVLGFLARALAPAGVVFVAWVDAAAELSGEAQRLARAGELPTLYVRAETAEDAAQPTQATPAAPPRRAHGVDHGISLCRAGALREGVAVLSSALECAPDPRSPERAEAWLHLAMAALQTHAVDTAVHASGVALAAAVEPSLRRRARRVALAVLRRTEQAEALRELGREAYAEIEAAEDPAERCWLRLDAALGCSMHDPEGRHDALLDALLVALPDGGDAPHACRTTAHLWKAASLFLRGLLQESLPHQELGLAGLSAMGDVSRALFVGARLASALVSAGRPRDSIARFQAVASLARWCGEHELAALAATEAVESCAAVGDGAGAEALFGAASASGERGWRGPRGALLRRRTLGHLAVLRADVVEARREAEALLAEARGLPPQHGQAAFAECCEAVYLLADAARLRGSQAEARALVETGLRLAADAGPEDRARLVARGAARLSRPSHFDVRVAAQPA